MPDSMLVACWVFEDIYDRVPIQLPAPIQNGVELELVEQMSLLEWFANDYKNFGATLEIITDRSQEGAQFVKGFGGIGGILRYKVDFQSLEPCEFDDDNDEAYVCDLDDY